MEDISNLSVLIGKNSSGKSNLLEALNMFFSDFSLTGGTTSGLDEYFWFNRHTVDPIEFTLNIKLEDAECNKIFPAEILNPVKETFKENFNEITIHRTLNPQGTWKTELVNWADLFLVKDDRGVTPEEFTNYWSQVATITAVGEKPDIVSIISPTVTPQILSTIFTKLAEALKGRFKLISAIRDVKSPMLHRMTLVDSAIQGSLWTLDQSTREQDEEKYTDIESTFRKISNLRLDLAQGRIYVRRDGRRFPLFLEGGGVQGSIITLFNLKYEAEKGFIFGIEEPEAHSHPELQRKLFDELKEISERAQIFIATHSPIFIDRGDLNNTWLVKLAKSETVIQRIGELKEILAEIGARPSDILFFKDRILFVEGKTEEIVLPAFAGRLNLDLKDTAIVPVEGKSRARAYLKTLVEMTRGMMPIFVILDKDAQEDMKQIEGLIPAENCHLWQKGTIESYYPEEILKSALTELSQRYGLEMDVEAIMKQIRKGELTPDKIDLGEKKKLLDRTWEIILGEASAKLMREKKEMLLSDEVRRVLERFVMS